MEGGEDILVTMVKMLEYFVNVSTAQTSNNVLLCGYKVHSNSHDIEN